MKPFKVLMPLIVLAAVVAAPAIRAEDTPAPAASTAAKLTPAQEAKIAELRKEEHKAINAIKEDKKIKDADKPAKIKAVKEDYKAQIAAVKSGK
ncbi:MAG: hypothetical protein WC205_02715 [Opitutaceae bacterium]|jgi:hypothetical protein